jgi:hypothetical protein
MFGQSLEIRRSAQEARRVAPKAASNANPALPFVASLPCAALFSDPNDMAAASTADTATDVIPPLPMLAQAEATV